MALFYQKTHQASGLKVISYNYPPGGLQDPLIIHVSTIPSRGGI
jgi:hypothetical protein